MTAEIIAVGSELLTPQRVDTNSLFLTRRLNERGIEVVRKTIVGDDRQRLADEIRQARGSSRVVIMTGGLGPTLDDISREAASDALGRGMAFHPEILEGIEALFRSFKRKMADINRRQAYILEGAEVLHNDNGTAPGQWFEDDDGILVLLPGPPGSSSRCLNSSAYLGWSGLNPPTSTTRFLSGWSACPSRKSINESRPSTPRSLA